MEEDANNEVDPPPDRPLKEVFFSEDSVPVSYSESNNPGSEMFTEYWAIILPNEDDDPEYWKKLLTSYRHGEDFLPGLRKIVTS